jgi:hypothetical protein
MYVMRTVVLACEIRNIKRLLVSDRYAAMGLYTFKFHKAGKVCVVNVFFFHLIIL